MSIKYFRASLICVLFFSLPVFTQRLVVDSSFTPAINGEVKSLDILSDGKILILGSFTVVNSVARPKIARLNADGSLDTSFNPPINTNWFIRSVTVLPDGKLLLTGSFGGGVPIQYVRTVLRLNADGTLDSTLTSIPQIVDGPALYVQKAVQLPNGKILTCGNFLIPNGSSQPYLARYNNDGTFDSTFTTAIDNQCRDIEVLPDGKYYVSGSYLNINGSPSQSLTRFNEDGTIDPSFNAAPIPTTTDHTYYREIKLQSDGKILAFRLASCCSTRVARLNPDGSLHTTFSTLIDEPGSFAVQSNEKVTIVAAFTSVFGQSFDLNRFNTDGTHDPSLPRMGFFGIGSPDNPKVAAFTADGKLIVGGNFTEFNFFTEGPRTTQPYLARLAPEAIPIKPKFDFDGDGRDDPAVFRPGNQAWYLNQSTAGFYATQFGLSTDKPIAADYDGDGRADIAVFRDGVWYYLRSSDSVFSYRVSGQAGDIPQPHYSSPARLVVWRPSAAKFYAQAPFGNPQIVEFRDMTLLPTDKPVVADYDGDGRADLAVFRDGNWFFMASNNLQTRQYQFGLAGDTPVIGDFDGDLRADYAVYRPSEGIWYIHRTTEGFFAVRWGLADDLPVPADYDGDGRTDIAVYRPSDGVWYELRSSGTYHFERFGLANDIPVQLR